MGCDQIIWQSQQGNDLVRSLPSATAPLAVRSAHTAAHLRMHLTNTIDAAAGEQRPLYQVLEQQQAQVGGNLMGSDHTYVIPGGKAAPGKKCALILRPAAVVPISDAGSSLVLRKTVADCQNSEGAAHVMHCIGCGTQ